jgi:hypothetical protein
LLLNACPRVAGSIRRTTFLSVRKPVASITASLPKTHQPPRPPQTRHARYRPSSSRNGREISPFRGRPSGLA